MFLYTVFLLIFATIPIFEAQIVCDPDMCNTVCQNRHMGSGTCHGGSCDCSSGKKCSELLDITCDAFCQLYKLKGECDADHCVCKAELELCKVDGWAECEESCEEDPRGKACVASGGIVSVIACLEYGPITTCGCLCTRFGTERRLTSVGKSKFNHFQQVITKDVSEFRRNYYLNSPNAV